VGTVRRRIERRMNVNQITTPAQYVRYLEQNPHEIDTLFKELLISVTSFFRDPEAFASLADTLLPELIKTRPDNHTFRIWVPGCASGEEVYSLAMLFREAMEVAKCTSGVQIFGSDLDVAAIDFARRAIFPEGIACDVSRHRLQKFFFAEEGHFRIRKDIREMAIFAVQNVIKDPPFTKLDLISCRNLLIYFNADLQHRLIPVFHYALKPGGLLFLGSSETVDKFTDLFEVVDKRWKIYRRKDKPNAGHPLLDFPSQQSAADLAHTATLASRTPREPGLAQQVERLLLERFGPTCALVNERGDVHYIHGRTGAWLEPAAGQPRWNILDMAREGLPLELSSAMREAATQTAVVMRKGIRVRSNGHFAHLDLSVCKLQVPESLRGLLLVTFEACPSPAQPAPVQSGPAHSPVHNEKLESELRHARQSLQGTVEALQTSNEELKSTNEELQSANEELQSANEEMETSKEELQSLNEELSTINAEMESKIAEMARLTDDMQNLLNSTEIATVFLDRDLKIKRYTEHARQLFSIVPSDIGRPLRDLVTSLAYDQLTPDCQTVLRTLAVKATEVRTKEGALVSHAHHALPHGGKSH
jgi:two-component system, chemotaxis family, CheB/CheR fusion protein